MAALAVAGHRGFYADRRGNLVPRFSVPRLAALAARRLARYRRYLAAVGAHPCAIRLVHNRPDLRVRPAARMDALGDRCLLYTSDAADDLARVYLGGRRNMKK